MTHHFGYAGPGRRCRRLGLLFQISHAAMVSGFVERRIHHEAGGRASGGLFDLLDRGLTEEPAVGQHARHHSGRGRDGGEGRRQFLFVVRGLADAFAYDQAADLPQIQRLHCVDHEVGEMVGRHPVAQIRREQQWGVAIDVYETSGHELFVVLPRPITAPVSKMSQTFSFSRCAQPGAPTGQ